jgi:hypothetical protein
MIPAIQRFQISLHSLQVITGQVKAKNPGPPGQDSLLLDDFGMCR